MPVPTLVTDLSTTVASNSPAGSDNVFPDLDNYLRALSGFVASIRDNSGNGWVSPYLPLAGGTVSGGVTFNGTLSGSGLTSYLASPAAIGGTTPAAGAFTTLSATGTSTATSFIPTGSTAPTNGMYLSAANTLAWATNAGYRLSLNANGQLLMRTANGTYAGYQPGLACLNAFTNQPAAVFDGGSTANPVAAFWNPATAGDNLFQQFGTEGTYTARGSISYNRAGGLVAYNTTSDYRAKDIIGPVQNPGTTIDALKVYEGRMKGATQSRPMLVAHEAQAVAPYAVSGVKDDVNEDGSPKFQQMDVSSLVPLLLAEIQSLRARVAALEAA